MKRAFAAVLTVAIAAILLAPSIEAALSEDPPPLESSRLYNFVVKSHRLACARLGGTASLRDATGEPVKKNGGGTLVVHNRYTKYKHMTCKHKPYKGVRVQHIEEHKFPADPQAGPTGPVTTMYYTWGHGRSALKKVKGKWVTIKKSGVDGQSGHVLSTDIAKWGAKRKFYDTTRGCSKKRVPPLCNGRDAPQYYKENNTNPWLIEPVEIPPSLGYWGPSTHKWTKADNYGIPAEPYGVDSTNLSWSWLGVKRGGIVRAQVQRGTPFFRANVKADRQPTYKKTKPGKKRLKNGYIEGWYGYVWANGKKIYGWVTARHKVIKHKWVDHLRKPIISYNDTKDGGWFTASANVFDSSPLPDDEDVDGYEPPSGPVVQTCFSCDQWASDVGNYASQTFAADVTGDGKADAVSYYDQNGEWEVARSDGDAFGRNSVWRTGFGNEESAVFLADVTGDGRADAIVYDDSTAEWRVARAGLNGFNDPVAWSRYATGDDGIFVADVTGDGRADLIRVTDSGIVSVAPSTGSSFRSAAVTWLANGVATDSDEVLLGDVDGDGDDDLVLRDSDAGTWRVAISSGTSFAPPQTWLTVPSEDPGFAELGDANGDGKLDATAYSDEDGSLVVALSTGTGFSAPARWINGFSEGANDVSIADVDGDGDGDAVSMVNETGWWGVAESSGSQFHAYGMWSGDFGLGSETRLSGDVTGDGRADAVTVDASGSWRVAPSSGAEFAESTEWDDDHAQGADHRVLADVNGDGKLDAVGVDTTAGEVTVSVSTGSEFDGPSTWVTGLAPGATSYMFADVNNDGAADAVARNGGVWEVALSNGTSFAISTQWSSDFGATATSVFTADVTGDGSADAIAFDADSGEWFVGTSSGAAFSTAVSWATGVGTGSFDQFVEDVNGDGAADAVTYSNETSKWYVSLSEGDRFQAPVTRMVVAGSGSTDRFVDDVNGDGSADAVLHYGDETAEEQAEWYVNPKLADGLPDVLDSDLDVGFEDAGNWWPISPTTQLDRLGDVDGDGKDDLVEFSDALDTWCVALSAGDAASGGFGGAIPPHDSSCVNSDVGSNADTFELADVNGDGRDDVVVRSFANNGNPVIRWEVGLSTGTSFDFTSDQGDSSAVWLDAPVAVFDASFGQVGDFSGDGKADVATIRPDGGIDVAVSDGTAFGQPLLWCAGCAYDSFEEALADKVVPADLDRDGKTDLVAYFDNLRQHGNWRRFTSTGSQFTETDATSDWMVDFGEDSTDQFVADVTGDEQADPVFFDKSTGEWMVARSEDDFDERESWLTGFDPNAERSLVGDVTGDGLADAVVWAPDGSGSGDWRVAQAFDRQTPETYLTGGPVDGGVVGSSSVTLSFEAEYASTFECSLDGELPAACASSWQLDGLADGPHDVEIRATDRFGNVETTPFQYSFSVDDTSPETMITAGPADSSTVSGASVEFSFSSESGATFVCQIDSQPARGCEAPHTTELLTDGPHTFTVTAVDAAGNSDPSPTIRNFTINAPEPLADTVIDAGPANEVNNDTPTFEFHATATPATFQCRLNISEWESCESPAMIRLQSGLAGLQTFDVRAIDSAGTPDPTPAQHAWNVDFDPPAVEIVTPMSGEIVNDHEVALIFNSDPDATTTCKLDDAPSSPCESPVTVPFNLNGDRTITVEATDPAGNSAVATVSVSVYPSLDTSFLQEITPATNADELFVNPGSTMVGATFECRINGGSWVACDTETPVDISPVPEGEATLEVRAVFDGVRDATPESANVLIDRTPPVITLTQRPPEFTTDTTPTISFEIDDPNPLWVCLLDTDLSDPEPQVLPCDFTIELPELNDGPHSFVIYAADQLLNLAEPQYIEFTVDTTEPDTTLISGPSGSVADPTPTFEFESSEPGAGFECDVDGGGYESCSSPFTKSSLDDGSHSVSIRALDRAGNRDQSPITVTFDVEEPAVTIVSPTPGETVYSNALDVVFTHTAEAVSTLCQLDGSYIEECTSPKHYVREIWPLPTLENGPHVLTITALDSIGHPTTFTVPFFIDYPETTTTSGTNPDILVGEDVTYTFESNDPLASFECAVTDSYDPPADWAPCVSPYTTPPATLRGTHVFNVRAKNASGVVDSTPEQWTYFAYQPLPVPIVSGPEGTTTESRPRFVLGEIDHGRYYCQVDNDTSLPDCLTIGPPLPIFQMPTLPAGEHTFKVWSKDGGYTSEPTVRTFTVDPGSPAPDTLFDHVPPAHMNGSTAAFEFFSFHSTLPNPEFECRRKFLGRSRPRTAVNSTSSSSR